MKIVYRTLWPPFAAPTLFDCNDLSSEPTVDPRQGRYDEKKYPLIHSSDVIVIEQGPGDAMFVPSGWYHIVENLPFKHSLGPSTVDEFVPSSAEKDLVVSINHNWFNAFGVTEVFDFLLRDLSNVRKEIAHLRAKVDVEIKCSPYS